MSGWWVPPAVIVGACIWVGMVDLALGWFFR